MDAAAATGHRGDLQRYSSSLLYARFLVKVMTFVVKVKVMTAADGTLRLAFSPPSCQ